VQYAIKDNARCQGGPPKRIIFFRDGVAETQFQAVMNEEVKAIQAAINSCYGYWKDNGWVKDEQKTPKPKLTFVVVGKRFVELFIAAVKLKVKSDHRHHIRFFPKDGV
jgi:eukaryotic translation initiation factor 2C